VARFARAWPSRESAYFGPTSGLETHGDAIGAVRSASEQGNNPRVIDPISLFREWLVFAERDHRLARPRSFCLSTVDADGAPDARFVDLKDVTDAGFVFSTPLGSGKARALAANPRAAMTFWWAPIERQVRVVGVATRVSELEADELFRSRSRDAQLASWASRQGAELHDAALLDHELDEARQRFADAVITRPESWGGFNIVPARVEFLSFREDRMHERTLFVRDGASWRTLRLQP
jgi:pyridoxamine 5'-phosphate oxidase